MSPSTRLTRFSDEAINSLADDLRKNVRGEVRFRDVDRALYSTDSSNYRQVPIGVIIPRDADDAVEAVAVCRRHQAPITGRGCGTSLAGQTANAAVIMDFSKYVNRVLNLDVSGRRARVEPGTIFDDLRHRAEQHGLTVAFDTSTHEYATIGGMVGNNSCGVHSVLAAKMGAGSGRTEDNIHELEVLTYDGLRLRVGHTSEEELAYIIRAGGRRGEIYAALKALRDKYAESIRQRFPDIPRRVSGYNLSQLLPEHGFNVARALVGTESTCVTVLEATVGLVPNPPKRALLVIGYEDIFSAGDHVSDVMACGPIGLEAIDARLVENMRRKGLHEQLLHLLPEGGGWLLAEFGEDTTEAAEEQAKALQERLSRRGGDQLREMRLYTDPADQENIWLMRESGLGATAFVPGRNDTWEGWEDSAVPPDRLGSYLRDFRSLLHRYGYEAALYGHFGQGCVHCRIPFDLTSEQGISDWRRFLSDAADLVVSYGGSLSGEHGDGQARAELLPRMYGDEIVQAFREFKAIWDPGNRMNPGKIVDPYPADTNLRLGVQYNRPELRTHFKFPEDGGSFSRAVLRCVGVGRCRRTSGGVMCPSFMATRDEEHTTRGRARSLFEMLHHPASIETSWRSDAVREALDLCLACKGCKRDCPVNVDMATYKAEFMAHYYKARLRPRSFYSMGLIHWWSRFASVMPRVANAAMNAPGSARLIKAAAGIAPERSFPPYARKTFRNWFASRGAPGEDGPEVVLFADTFTNYFQPAAGAAAVEVLEAAGYRVRVPRQVLCCGRPLYDKGFLNLAKRQLRQLIQVLGHSAMSGVPIIGLEPSCVAAFRDELINMYPDDERARDISRRTTMLGEFLREDRAYVPPRLDRKAIVQFHCNHHAILEVQPELDLMKTMGLELDVLNSGCCGMAGSFGFEREHYDVSKKCGERVLLPAVRAADNRTLIVADGFSCREQIAQATPRRALHLAQILQIAYREGSAGPADDFPERGYEHSL